MLGVMQSSRISSSLSLSFRAICASFTLHPSADTGGMKQAPRRASMGHREAISVRVSVSSADSCAPDMRLALSLPILAMSSSVIPAVSSLNLQ